MWIQFKLSLIAIAALAVSVAGMAPATADIITTSCGATTKTKLRTVFNETYSTTSSTFKNLPHAKFTVVVPAGEQHCVKVRFSAQSSCTSTTAEHCFVRVMLDGGTSLDPSVVFGTDSELGANSFEWGAKLLEGTNDIQIQVMTSGTQFLIANWTASIEETE